MKPEEFFKMQEEQKKREAEMSYEERKALEEARRRHARKVRSEVITSFELDGKREEKEKNEEE